MKNFYHALFVLLLITCSLFGQTHDVSLSFITINGYSNSLYIDNVTVGSQFSSDIAVVSLNNLAADTSYALGSSNITISPNVTIINVGTSDINLSFDVIMSASPIGYSSTMPVASLNSGASVEVIFDPLSITPGTPIDVTIYSMLPGDENTSNDSLFQYTSILSGVQRSNVLLQEWTSATCAPCASNNPTIDAFVDTNFDSIVPVKYHVWWPSPGNDPMYLYNTTQVQYRVGYYGVGGVPNVIIGGVYDPVYPYTTPGSLQDGYDEQWAKGTPIEITATDTRLPGDSIQTDVSITIHAPLRAGDYTLQVEALERLISYASAPGSNGETDFYDVFRRAYPDEFGTSIPTSIGTHNFLFKYAIDTAAWVDSMIYSIAYVQDNVTKEIWGSDKGNSIVPTKNTEIFQNHMSNSSISKPISIIEYEALANYSILEGKFGGFNYELFEAAFPPDGWRVVNPDGGITFEKYDGVNGLSFGGNNSAFVDFYSYGSTGEIDTMYTSVYTGTSLTDSIKFEYAHAEYPNYGPDRLIVKLSTDGGLTYPNIIFDKTGNDLATAPATTNFFEPTSGQWAMFSISLSDIISSIPTNSNIATDFKLEQNYPNPFNPSTYISYTLPLQSKVNLIIFNTLGQEVRTLISNTLQPKNQYKVFWNGKDNSGSDVSSGVYYYKLVSQSSNNTLEQSKKMLLIK